VTGGPRTASSTRPSPESREGRGFDRIAWAGLALAISLVVALPAFGYLSDDGGSPWYGDWGAVAFAVAFFSVFVLAFLRSPRQREWRHLGISEAYLVALFTEMFGTPLTVYLLGSVLGVNLGFGMLEGHLWAVLLDRLGVLPLAQGVAVVMAISSALIFTGLALMAAGWWQVWRARSGLVTNGLYRFVRHPQYLGFLLLIYGFLVQWPTLPTLMLFPVLIFVYYRLARREEATLEREFGGRYAAYRARTPMLVPFWPGARGSAGEG
jgi:protein-S-isoprenylcysteine O-methyltransferase Ste14